MWNFFNFVLFFFFLLAQWIAQIENETIQFVRAEIEIRMKSEADERKRKWQKVIQYRDISLCNHFLAFCTGLTMRAHLPLLLKSFSFSICSKWKRRFSKIFVLHNKLKRSKSKTTRKPFTIDAKINCCERFVSLHSFWLKTRDAKTNACEKANRVIIWLLRSCWRLALFIVRCLQSKTFNLRFSEIALSHNDDDDSNKAVEEGERNVVTVIEWKSSAVEMNEWNSWMKYRRNKMSKRKRHRMPSESFETWESDEMSRQFFHSFF